MIAPQRVERIPGSPAVTLQWITFLFAAFLSLLNWPLVSNRAFQLSELSETVICRSGQWKGRVEEPLKSDSTSKYAASFCNGPCRYNSREWVTTSWQFIVLMFCFMGYWFLWTLDWHYFYCQRGGPWDLHFVLHTYNLRQSFSLHSWMHPIFQLKFHRFNFIPNKLLKEKICLIALFRTLHGVIGVLRPIKSI